MVRKGCTFYSVLSKGYYRTTKISMKASGLEIVHLILVYRETCTEVFGKKVNRLNYKQSLWNPQNVSATQEKQ